MDTRNILISVGSLVRVRAVRALPLSESLPDGALVIVEEGRAGKAQVRFKSRRYRIDFAKSAGGLPAVEPAFELNGRGGAQTPPGLLRTG